MMKIKRYTGENALEAMRKVKAELGPDALIMSTGKVRQKGALGMFRKPVVEVVAAIDDQTRRQMLLAKVASTAGAAGTAGTAGVGYADAAGASHADAAGAGIGAGKAGTIGASAASAVGAGKAKPTGTVSPGKPLLMPPPASMPAGEAFIQFQRQLRKLAIQDVQQGELREWKPPNVSAAPHDALLPDGLAAPQNALLPDGLAAHPGGFIERSPVSPSPSPQQAAAAATGAAVSATGAAGAAATGAAAAAAVAAPSERLAEIEEKITRIESMLAGVCHDFSLAAKFVQEDSPPEQFATLSSALKSYYDCLVRSDVEPEFALSIVERVGDSLKDADENADVAEAVYRELRSALGTPKTIHISDDKKPTVALFIGPTGVGKTTTLAKIAANYALGENLKVGMVTADTYRIAAVQQLRTYADILGIPLAVVHSPRDMPRALEENEDKDIVLIDTAGRSYRNKAHFDELKELISQCRADEVFLVMSSTSGIKCNREIISHYAFLDEFKLIVTKADEAPTFGSLLNARMLTGKDLSYITVGQSVPDDIEVASVEKIARLLIGELAG